MLRLLRWIAICALALTACGGASASAQQTVDRITVGVVPLVDVAPVYLGIQQGFFKEQRLEVDIQTGQGGAAVVTSVVSGAAQFGFANTVSEILALSKGLKLKAVAPGAQSSDDPNRDAVAVIVRGGDGGVRSCRDLENRTIAVNQVANIAEVTLRYSCEQRGANVSTFKFVEVPFPDMLAELQRGRVDAVDLAEPFTTQALQAGNRALCYCFVDTYPHLTVATYVTSAAYAGGHADVVSRFTAAIRKSLTYTQDHPDQAREQLAAYTQIPAPARQSMVLPYWSQDLNKPSIERMGQIMVWYGLIAKAPDLSSLYVK